MAATFSGWRTSAKASAARTVDVAVRPRRAAPASARGRGSRRARCGARRASAPSTRTAAGAARKCMSTVSDVTKEERLDGRARGVAARAAGAGVRKHLVELLLEPARVEPRARRRPRPVDEVRRRHLAVADEVDRQAGVGERADDLRHAREHAAAAARRRRAVVDLEEGHDPSPTRVAPSVAVSRHGPARARRPPRTAASGGATRAARAAARRRRRDAAGAGLLHDSSGSKPRSRWRAVFCTRGGASRSRSRWRLAALALLLRASARRAAPPSRRCHRTSRSQQRPAPRCRAPPASPTSREPQAPRAARPPRRFAPGPRPTPGTARSSARATPSSTSVSSGPRRSRAPRHSLTRLPPRRSKRRAVHVAAAPRGPGSRGSAWPCARPSTSRPRETQRTAHSAGAATTTSTRTAARARRAAAAQTDAPAGGARTRTTSARRAARARPRPDRPRSR